MRRRRGRRRDRRPRGRPRARLRDPDLRVAVFEREPRIAVHQTGHSSGVIHSGIYYAPGLAEGAALRRRGAASCTTTATERGIPAARTGKLIVATGAERAAAPRRARAPRARQRGPRPAPPRHRSEAREFEPHAAGLEALHSPSTGVVDFAAVAGAFAADLERAGGTVHLGCEVESLGDGTLVHAQGTTRARATISCAGAWSDRLAVAAGAPRRAPDRPLPRRLPAAASRALRPGPGEHLPGARPRAAVPRRPPDPRRRRLGAARADRAARRRPRRLSPDADRAADLRETLAWPGTWRLIAPPLARRARPSSPHAASKRALVAAARRLVPELRAADFVAGPAGVRAQALGRDGSLVDDFVVSRAGGALFVRNAPSPAATSSLPLGRLIADEAAPLLA